MHSLLFSLEASLLAPLIEFALSPSGHVEPRRGLALGWLGSVVAGLAVVFGTADRAQASCSGISEGECYTEYIEPCWCPPPLDPNAGEYVRVTCRELDGSCETKYQCLC